MKYLPSKSTMNGLLLDSRVLSTSTAFLFGPIDVVVLLVVVIAVLEIVVSSIVVSKKRFDQFLTQESDRANLGLKEVA